MMRRRLPKIALSATTLITSCVYAQDCVPKIIGNADIVGNAGSIDVSGHLAVVLDEAGLEVVSFKSPTSPQVTGSTPLNGSRLTAQDHLAFVGGSFDFSVVDFSNPQSPWDIGGIASYPIIDLAVEGDLVYAARGDDGLALIDVSDPVEPFVLSTIGTPGEAVAVSVSVGTTVVADLPSSIQLVDTSKPASPMLLGDVDVGSPVAAVAAEDSIAVITGITTTHVVDFSDHRQPMLVASLKIRGNSVVLEDGLAYVTYSPEGEFTIIDVNDPTAPFVAGSLDTPGLARDVAPAQKLALIADGKAGVQVVSVFFCQPCPADFNDDGALNVLDFVAFQIGWLDGDPFADCDANGVHNVLDFVCFQFLFSLGCD